MITSTCPSYGCECALFFLYLWNKRMKQQLVEADSDVNRYFFAEAHGREAESFEELLFHYIYNGGAETFSQTEKMREFDPMI